MSSEEIKIGSKASESIVCSHCQATVPAGQFFTFKGAKGVDVNLCAACKDKVEKTLKEETENPNIPLAVLVGCAAGIIGGIAWYWFVELTHYQIGYLAIGIGWLVGQGVILGSGKKRGPTLQLAAALITLVTLYISNYFIFLDEVRKYITEHNGYQPGAYFFISPIDADVLKSVVSPIGLLIWGIGLYFAYTVPKSRTI